MHNSIFIKTYGCPNNQAESEIMSGLLSKNGYDIITESLDNKSKSDSARNRMTNCKSAIAKVDIIIINTCVVKSQTENKIIDEIISIVKEYPGKKLIIAGCMPEIRKKIIKKKKKKASMISTHHIDKIVDVVNKITKSSSGDLARVKITDLRNKSAIGKTIERVVLTGKASNCKLLHPRIRTNDIVHITPISSGCSSACAYCATKLAKGELQSYNPEVIVNEIKNGLKQGCKEFWLTAQDCGCYGMDIMTKSSSRDLAIGKITDLRNKSAIDINTNLPTLINRIASLEGTFFLRIGMMNPMHLRKFYPELIKAYSNDKVFKFLHLPVQSGSDKLLQSMNRGYTNSEFIEIINAFKKAYPMIHIWTDVIAGLPGETEDDFQKTIGLLKKTAPEFTNVSRFTARPGTAAAEMEQIPNRIINERSSVLSELTRRITIKKNKQWIGWSGKAIIEEHNQKKNSYLARNYAYKPIVITKPHKDLVNGKRLELGQIINVKIIDTEKILFGKIL
ncbi:MAG: MiaB/RimO family radical SAM methylthiotransferase [Candidatus Aenigmarchaeota archaeon]|nr:MiaB/RimO family radical SAM methylthiotransferase [Candidatus Aenigmarchaeota archaeon]